MIRGPLTIVILGGQGVGKTNLVNQIQRLLMTQAIAPVVRIEDGEEPNGPVNANFVIRTVQTQNEQELEMLLELLDETTAGPEEPPKDETGIVA